MVDNMNPSSQFHPYLPVTATPASELLQNNSPARLRAGVILGGLAALLIGAALMGRRQAG